MTYFPLRQTTCFFIPLVAPCKPLLKYLYEKAEQYKDEMQVIVVNNGHPSFIPSECVVAEFDSDGRDGLPIGLIDDAL